MARPDPCRSGTTGARSDQYPSPQLNCGARGAWLSRNYTRHFREPGAGINPVLSLIGLPLFCSVNGGSNVQQQRQIAIADLQVKVAEVERGRAQMANDLREEVMLQVLAFEQSRREFQGQKEIRRRATLRNEILTLNYRFVADSLTTPQYLQELNSLDGQRLQAFKTCVQLRTLLTRIKILVLGSESV